MFNKSGKLFDYEGENITPKWKTVTTIQDSLPQTTVLMRAS